MKKHHFVLLLTTVALTFSTTSRAQFALASNNRKTAAAPAVEAFESTPAFKNFHKDFPNGANESWGRTKEGFTVWFTLKGIQQRAYLSKSGLCEGLIRYYGEQELPKDVRHSVKSIYYDYSITAVQEVTCNQATAYLITVENKTTWKVVRVVEGEMDIREDHVKAE